MSLVDTSDIRGWIVVLAAGLLVGFVALRRVGGCEPGQGRELRGIHVT